MCWCLVTYGKRSGAVLAVSRRMTLRAARRRARNNLDIVDIVTRY